MYNRFQERYRTLEELYAYVEAVPGEVLKNVMVGDTIVVKGAVNYKGPLLQNIPFHAAICQIVLGVWDPIWEDQVNYNFGPNTDFTPYNLRVIIPITEVGVAPWTPGLFSLYAELKGRSDAGRPQLPDCIEVLVKPTFEPLTIISFDVIKGP